ncbi:hypothetical protein [Alkalimonas amylolytica]|uniref:Nucleoside-diphosphate-sugar epimerase n=1 Tax=Alkalimonas amylolytica TaxID=152573 RepID=A0A1H3XZZ2_ALKAM|nr:hypothetical protein [Alkalimonas amylolytica]SEA05045.1 Nucleoside-diphosphate-sugar epimerase [Alkalimonas amylolytica]
MKVILLGCGWLGRQLLPVLQQDGHQLVVTRQSETALAELPGSVSGQVLSLPLSLPFPETLMDQFQQAVVICAITPGWRKQGGAGYLDSLQSLARLVQAADSLACVHFSSTGAYNGLSDEVDEQSQLAASDAKAQLLYQGEQLLQQALPTCTLRLAGLIGPGRHPGKFLRSGVLDDPDAPVNMVHSHDVIEAVRVILQQQAWPSLYNLSCPDLVTRQQFYQQARALLQLPALTVGAAGSSQRRVLAHRISRQLPFHYRYPSALHAVLECS